MEYYLHNWPTHISRWLDNTHKNKYYINCYIVCVRQKDLYMFSVQAIFKKAFNLQLVESWYRTYRYRGTTVYVLKTHQRRYFVRKCRCLSTCCFIIFHHHLKFCIFNHVCYFLGKNSDKEKHFIWRQYIFIVGNWSLFAINW